MGWVVNAAPLAALPSGQKPRNYRKEVGWAQECVLGHVPAALLPRKGPGTHCIGGLVGPRAGLDGWGKSHHPPGFDHRTVQRVASRYSKYAILGHQLKYSNKYDLEIFSTW
jgi:hypothetical protein